MSKVRSRSYYHPKTGQLFSDRVSTRVRQRNLRFKDGREYLDNRPMAAAIMFADEVLPEERMRQMMTNADLVARSRLQALEHFGGEVYDEDFDHYADAEDLDDPWDSDDDRYRSPGEFIFDPEVGREVPRFLKGRLKQAKEPAEEGLPLGLPSPTLKAKEPSKKAPERKAEPVSRKASAQVDDELCEED